MTREAIERQSAAGQQPPRAEFADYVRELQRIALGHDPSGSARDRLTALKELLKLGVTGTTSFIEGPSAEPPWPSAAELEMQRRWQAVDRAQRTEKLEQLESSLGIGE